MIRRSWRIQSKLNISQLQDELCSSIIFMLIFSFSTPARLTVLAHFTARTPNWEMVGLRLGPYVLIQLEAPMCCLWYIQKTVKQKDKED